MSLQTIKGWISTNVPDSELDDQYYTFTTYKPSGECLVPIQEHSFEVDVPDDFDPRPVMLDALNKKDTQLRADFAKALMELQEQKSRLLALENNPSEAGS